MAELTLRIDDDVLRRAPIRALEQGTSVNAVVRNFLRSYASTEEQVAAATAFVDLAANRWETGTRSGLRTWSRDELYDKAVG